ncbi:uncharacterized protein LOC143466107 [Clavelina lepadiformis]|uniref:uncharacterized protein LOC143466107 n=1 Tax=Clavelina lepadiformis TaxID=159417 RepID=UPI0040411E00
MVVEVGGNKGQGEKPAPFEDVPLPGVTMNNEKPPSYKQDAPPDYRQVADTMQRPISTITNQENGNACGRKKRCCKGKKARFCGFFVSLLLFALLGTCIYLAVNNHHYKKKYKELRMTCEKDHVFERPEFIPEDMDEIYGERLYDFVDEIKECFTDNPRDDVMRCLKRQIRKLLTEMEERDDGFP